MATPTPALYDHCEQVYKELLKDATRRDGQQVWEGALTKVFTSLGFSTPYYSHVTKALKAMDCIRQLRRGGGGTDSVWLLVQKPTPALWESFAAPAMKKPPQAEVARQQRLNDINHRLDRIESRLKVLEAKNG
jgi:hypothetical protein